MNGQWHETFRSFSRPSLTQINVSAVTAVIRALVERAASLTLSLSDDIDDSEKFLPIPDKSELDLGKPLASDFVRQFLRGNFDDVRQFFSRRGGCARLKE